MELPFVIETVKGMVHVQKTEDGDDFHGNEDCDKVMHFLRSVVDVRHHQRVNQGVN